MLKHILKVSIFILIFGAFSAQAQITAVYNAPERLFEEAKMHFDHQLYGLASDKFHQYIKDAKFPVAASQYVNVVEAELLYARCALFLERPNGEQLLLEFANNYAPSRLSDLAKFELGNYYYDNGKYNKALTYLKGVNGNYLDAQERSELHFRLGYSSFVRKNFGQAKASFRPIVENRASKYYYPANYYHGLAHYYTKGYDEALVRFKNVNSSKKYGKVIPYYMALIYYGNKNFDKVIEVGNAALNKKSIKNRNELNGLVGQAYFQKEQYSQALPNLEAYVKSGAKMSESASYQLAYIYKSQGQCEKAIKFFKNLSSRNSQLGQNAMYNLADCYLKTGEKNGARNAFQKASALKFDKKIQAESYFNYAKLSYELGRDREALKALNTIERSSPYYGEAQRLLSSLFVSTKDYGNAIKLLEGMNNRTRELDIAYQRVLFYQGVKDFRKGKHAKAGNLFSKSRKIGADPKTSALAQFWLADLDYRKKKYASSIGGYSKFLSDASGLGRLPSGSTPAMAQYAIGYNQLRLKSYDKAAQAFSAAINGFEYTNDFIQKKIKPDSYLRLGDTQLKLKKYNTAIQRYNWVINGKHKDFDYAMYQRAIALELKDGGTAVDKIIALEKLYQDYPKSNYADNAMVLAGKSYLKMGKLNQGSAVLNSMVNKYKGKSNLVSSALLNLGLIAYNQGDANKALGYYKRVFRNNPTPAESRTALGSIEEIYLDRNDPDGYFRFVESVSDIKVSDIAKDSLRYLSAEKLYENGEYKRAIESFDKYISKYPNGRYALQAYFQRGVSHAQLENYTKALADYEKILERGQSQYYLRALERAAKISYSYEKSYVKSYNYFKELEGVTSYEDVRFLAQMGAMRSAYYTKDIKGMELFSQKVTANKLATNEDVGEAQYYLGKIAFENKNYENARIHFDAVTKFSNDERAGEAHYRLAQLKYISGDLNGAKSKCLSINQETSYDDWIARAYILLSDIFKDQGDTFNAKAALRSVLNNFEDNAEITAEAKAKLKQLDALEMQKSNLINDTDVEGNLLMDDGQ